MTDLFSFFSFFKLSLSSPFLAIIFRFCKNSSKLFTIEFKGPLGETVRDHTSAGSCTSAFMKVVWMLKKKLYLERETCPQSVCLTFPKAIKLLVPHWETRGQMVVHYCRNSACFSLEMGRLLHQRSTKVFQIKGFIRGETLSLSLFESQCFHTEL